MPPVKPNNQISRVTRAATRKNKQPESKQTQNNLNKQIKPSKSNKSLRSISKDSANETASDNQETMATGIANRNCYNLNDAKTTVRKKSFDSKPIMKDVMKRLSGYSKQYTPEYFANILEYMIEKEVKNTMSPTAEKIKKWRKFMAQKYQVAEQVRKEVKKVRNVIIKNRRELNEQQKIYRGKHITQQYANQNIHNQNKPYSSANQQADSSSQSRNSIIPVTKSQKLPSNNPISYEISENSSQYSSYDSSQNNYLYENSSLPQFSSSLSSNTIVNLFENPQQITQQYISNEWNTKFDKFVCLIDTIYELLGQNQCANSIFPACYIFYSLVISDPRVFRFFDKNYKMRDNYRSHSNPHFNHESSLQGYYHSSQSGQSSPNQMIEYYVIVSLLISTKYHDIYPVSAADMIDSINYSLSMDRLLRIECQVLQMFDFSQFFNESEMKFLSMFIVVVGWTAHEKNICEFILQSGLNNPKLYRYSPLHKAAVTIGFYEDKFMKTQEKFMMVKNLCPGLTFELAKEIKKQYLQILFYNHNNHFIAQKKKFYIFDNEIKNLTKKTN